MRGNAQSIQHVRPVVTYSSELAQRSPQTMQAMIGRMAEPAKSPKSSA